MGATVRFQDWPSRLEAIIRSRERAPFSWGTNDCVLFAADAINAMTGCDPWPGIRGRYRTALGASRLIKQMGGIESAVSESFDRIKPSFAGRGDLLLFRSARGPYLGICTGIYGCAPAEFGLLARPYTDALMAWKV